MREWRTIDTYEPQDTETVLLFTTEGIELAWWSAHGNEFLTNDGKFIYGEPTHWQPLPEPPKD